MRGSIQANDMQGDGGVFTAGLGRKGIGVREPPPSWTGLGAESAGRHERLSVGRTKPFRGSVSRRGGGGDATLLSPRPAQVLASRAD